MSLVQDYRTPVVRRGREADNMPTAWTIAIPPTADLPIRFGSREAVAYPHQVQASPLPRRLSTDLTASPHPGTLSAWIFALRSEDDGGCPIPDAEAFPFCESVPEACALGEPDWTFPVQP